MNTKLVAEQEILEYGKRIGFFLEQLDAPISFKRVISDLIPELTLEQIDLVRLRLEQEVIEQTAIEMTPEFQEKMTEQNKKTNQELDQLLSEIN